MGPPPVAGGSLMEPEERHRLRYDQLQHLTDEAFAAEVRAHEASQWRPANLQRHAQDHWRDFLDLLGRILSAGELAALSRDVLGSWDRLFTEMERDGTVSYTFVRLLADPNHAIIVITRAGDIRSLFPYAST